MATPDPGRFERFEGSIGGTKIASRGEVYPDSSAAEEARIPALFMAKLWALFGPATAIDGGFAVPIQDRETGLRFRAYSGPSGPSYGGRWQEREALLPVIRALEQLLDRTDPVDCQLKIAVDVEYGGGALVIGVDGGEPFERRAVKRRAAVERVETTSDCLRQAERSGRHYGPKAGFQTCIAKVLPELPDQFEWRGDRYSWCVGFEVPDHGPPVFLFDEGPGLVQIPVDEIPFAEPLSPAAQLWLEALRAWQAERGGGA